jgi:hypothetical protein
VYVTSRTDAKLGTAFRELRASQFFATGCPRRESLLFDYEPSRSRDVPKRLLEGFQGNLRTDGSECDAGSGRTPGISETFQHTS